MQGTAPSLRSIAAPAMAIAASARPRLFPPSPEWMRRSSTSNSTTISSGKRLWGVMSAIATALSAPNRSTWPRTSPVARTGCRPSMARACPRAAQSAADRSRASSCLRRRSGTGDSRPCAACHGPGSHKLGAPALKGQHAAYIERQLAAFAEGDRRNDIDRQIRIAEQLTPGEMHAVAGYYGS